MRLPGFFMFFLWFVCPAVAHEFWIEPKSYVLPLDSIVIASLFNGQNFAGTEFPYYPKNFQRFELAFGEQVESVPGRIGDYPAMNMAALGDGLHAALFVSSGDLVNYAEFSVFLITTADKDFRNVEARHFERALPLVNFREYYTRYSKALVGVGSAAGQDRAHGMETEIVALKNPYTDNLDEGAGPTFPILVLYRGAPRGDAQVELFAKDLAGLVTVTKHRTNTDGVALLPVTKGHSYLVDAVVLREPEAGSVAMVKGAVWETLWAALTFAVPG